MPQAQLPIFPAGTTEINAQLAFERRDDQVTYFHGLLPVFQHNINDTKTFHLIASQLYVNGNATQADICRAFGITSISIKRAVKCYREKGPAGFYEAPNRRGAAVLTPAVLAQAQQLLNDGADISEVSDQLAIKTNTLQKAVTAGRLHKPIKKNRKIRTLR